MKRLLFLFLLVLSLACTLDARRRWIPKVASSPPPTPPALITNGAAQALTGNVTVSSLNTTGANFLVMYAGWYNGGYTPSDLINGSPSGNTWTALTSRTSGVSYTGQMWYCANANVGANHSFAITPTGGGAATMCVAAFSNVTASPFQTQNFATASAASTVSAGSITPSQTYTLLISGVTIGDNGVTPISINSSYSITNAMQWVGGTAIGAGLAYKVVSSTSAENPTWTIGAVTVELVGYHAAFSY